MLNIGPKASGEVPQQSINNLLEVGKWLKVNGEAIYNTRKFKVTHEGPTSIDMSKGTEGREEHGFKAQFTPQDFWFTQKENAVYAIAFEYPKTGKEILIESITKENIKSVTMLGSNAEIKWTQTKDGLKVDIGEQKGNPNGYALKIQY